LHDLLLRSISVFGVYDPQSLRDEPGFISFMAKMSESEMRGLDNTFFEMLSDFTLKMYKKTHPQETIKNEKVKKTLLFKELVHDELKNYVLPKLAKRINVDTNIALTNNLPPDDTIKLKNIFYDMKSKDLNILVVHDKSVYLRIKLSNKEKKKTLRNITLSFKEEIENSFIEQKVYENQSATDDNQVLNEYISSPEYAFLFKYLFPVTQTLNNIFMINCLSTSTRRQIVNAFHGTKSDVMTTCKIIQTGGQSIAVDPNNPQSVTEDPLSIIAGFLLSAIIKTPIQILKGVAESSEPNIAIVSTGFKLARTFVPSLSSLMIPAVSIPLGTIPTPITCPLPFMNPLMAIAYFALLAWYDDKPADAVEVQKEAQAKAIFQESIICKDVINPDNFYTDGKTPIETGNYLIKPEIMPPSGRYQSKPPQPPKSNNSNSNVHRPPLPQVMTPIVVIRENVAGERSATINQIVQSIAPIIYYYIELDRRTQTQTHSQASISDKLTQEEIKQIVIGQVENMENAVGDNHKLTSDQDPNYQVIVNASIDAAKTAIDNKYGVYADALAYTH
jgi:hypothetical protein